jgi:hypothetical protein
LVISKFAATRTNHRGIICGVPRLDRVAMRATIPRSMNAITSGASGVMANASCAPSRNPNK